MSILHFIRARWKVLLGFCLFFIVAVYYYWSEGAEGYYRNPIDGTLQLAANFGELRENHFHMGLDIRTRGREGLPVYAAADGYISHFSVAADGLGNAVFVRHPNGRTTVYGHLSKFATPEAEHVAQAEYARRSWAIEVDAPPALFPVRQGQLIAYSGNTGASRAPHLHFEVRDTQTGRNLNPQVEGLTVGDDIAPVVGGLYWYDRRYSTYTARARKVAIAGRDGRYHSVDDIVRVNSPLISLGIQALDRNSESSHISGIYAAELWMDDTMILAFNLDSLLPSDTRYINACIDYTKWIRSGIYVQHLSVLPGNHAPIFHPSGRDGLLRLGDMAVHRLYIKVRDVKGNYTQLEMKMQYTGDPVSLTMHGGDTAEGYLMIPGREASLVERNCRVRFRAAAFYDRLPFGMAEEAGGSNAASSSIRLLDETVPVHDAYQVWVRTLLRAGDAARERTVMELESGDSRSIQKGVWEADWMRGSFSRLGTVRLVVDREAPVMRTEGWEDGQEVGSDREVLAIAANDNLGVIARFEGEMDGRWVAFSQKGNVYSYALDKNCEAGRHRLFVRALDVAGNETKRVFYFIKKG